MDCDALHHSHGIKLNNVHDTSSYHQVLRFREDIGLNDLLTANGVHVNDSRDKSIYRRNPAFWSERPLTEFMIQWASADVDKLLQVATMQKASASSSQLQRAKDLSKERSLRVPAMKLETGLLCRVNIGRFIGKGGSTLRSLQKRSNTLIYQDHERKTWMVYYTEDSGLNAVKRALGYS